MMGVNAHLPSSLMVKLCRSQGDPDMNKPNPAFLARAADALERTMEDAQSNRRWLKRARGILRKGGYLSFPDDE